MRGQRADDSRAGGKPVMCRLGQGWGLPGAALGVAQDKKEAHYKGGKEARWGSTAERGLGSGEGIGQR